MNKKWKKIKDYEDYQISNYGDIKSLKKGKVRILKPSKTKQGYLQIVLCENSKTKNFCS